MSFQAPFDIADMRRVQMQENALRQQQQMAMFDGIGSAIDNLVGGYMQNEQKKAQGKAFKNAFNVIAPSLGMDEATLKSLTGELKSPKDWADFGQTVAPFIPSMVNATLASGRMGIQQNQPYVNAGIQNSRDLASGKGTWQPSGTSPVEPTLPVADENLPPLDPPLAPSTPAGPTAPSLQRAAQWWQGRSKMGP